MTSRRTVLKSAALVAATGLLPKMAFGQSAKYAAKIAHLEAPSQPRHKGLEKVSALVKERTNGEVEFTIYPLSQLGNARQMIEGTQFGAIECTVQPAAFLGGFNPVVSVLDVPYLFPSDRALSQKLREGAFGQALLKSFESRGLHALTEWPNGRKCLTSNKPLDSVSRRSKFLSGCRTERSFTPFTILLSATISFLNPPSAFRGTTPISTGSTPR